MNNYYNIINYVYTKVGTYEGTWLVFGPK